VVWRCVDGLDFLHGNSAAIAMCRSREVACLGKAQASGRLVRCRKYTCGVVMYGCAREDLRHGRDRDSEALRAASRVLRQQNTGRRDAGLLEKELESAHRPGRRGPAVAGHFSSEEKKNIEETRTSRPFFASSGDCGGVWPREEQAASVISKPVGASSFRARFAGRLSGNQSDSCRSGKPKKRESKGNHILPRLRNKNSKKGKNNRRKKERQQRRRRREQTRIIQRETSQVRT